MLSLVAQWRQSNQTQKDFCLFHGLKLCTLSYWIKRSQEQNNGPEFKEILPYSEASNRVEILYPNGVKINVKSDLALIGKLIQLY